jgi:recombinational DNA repair protein (RecF pathway)
MTREIKYCSECGTSYAETHHIIYRRHCKSLENCKLNLIDLCYTHHRDHKEGVHFNKELDNRLKLEFQNKLEMLFNKEYLTREEIKEVLEIANKPLGRLLKTLTLQKGKYVREDIIRAVMGGKLVIEGN